MGVRVWEQGMGRCGLLGTVSVLQDEKHSKMDGVNTGNTSILSATESHFNPCKGLKRLYAACMCVRAQSLQSPPTVCNPVDCSPPGSLVSRRLQARIVAWAAIPFSRGGTQVSYTCCTGSRVLYHECLLGSP